MSIPKSTEICGCCGVRRVFDLFERALSPDGSETELRICSVCSVVTTVFDKAYSTADTQAVAAQQASSSAEFYDSQIPKDLDSVRDEIQKHAGIIDFLDPLIGSTENKVFAELGYGRGLLLLAAAAKYRQAIGFEVQHDSLRSLVKALFGALPDNISLFDSIEQTNAKLDVLVLWHTLEHLINPHKVLTPYISRLKEGGLLYFQVPLFRPAYLCATHYWFFNARAVETFLDMLRLEPVNVSFDTGNAFLTVVGRKERTSRSRFFQAVQTSFGRPS
jgi:Methyltransferase domain